MASSSRRVQEELAPKDLTEFICVLQEMAYAMKEQAAVAHQMMEEVGWQPKEGHGGNPNRAKVDLEYLKFAEFRKANPPSFRGAFSLDEAEEWIKSMEKVFWY